MSDCVAYPPTHRLKRLTSSRVFVGWMLQHSQPASTDFFFSFNRQNVEHNGLSWPFSSSVISKCTLSGALLLHTIEKSLRGGGWGWRWRLSSHGATAAIHLQLNKQKPKFSTVLYGQGASWTWMDRGRVGRSAGERGGGGGGGSKPHFPTKKVAFSFLKKDPINNKRSLFTVVIAPPNSENPKFKMV